ncbi:DUF6350 family protein [Leucobacter ruminantium]|uniref:Uncharacterized protein n=1 Tax=Leucobacter ruminantium TaxID=1289170 RepID=A0A939LW05_9MICO|nr:DUF6350 family protein [Leucobacter ruminantium]MBO1804198.1 hypothetical protein [Leucobacter ruminantium]
MRAVLTAVVAAIEAAAVALVGLAVVVVPAVLLWVITFSLAAEPGEVFGSAVGVWFLAHLVPLEFPVSAEAAVGLGLPQAAFEFPFSLAPLGITLITVALGARAGWRFGARGGAGAGGVLGGGLGFAAVAAVVSPVAGGVLARPVWAAVLAAAAFYAASSLCGFVVRAVREDHGWWRRLMRSVQRGIGSLGLPGDAAFPVRLGETFRLAAASLLALLGLASIGLAIALVAGYVQVATLSQALQLDGLGAFAVFLLQLALLPVFLIWAASWLTGAGFSVGIGSSATPFESLLGPMPALPLFGAIPQGWGSGGALAPALVVLVGAGVGAAFARRPLLRRTSWTAALSMAAAAGVITGLVCTGAGALARGAIGPDRLAEAGPHPWLLGGLAAAELGGGLLLGVAAGRWDGARLRAVLSGEHRGSGGSEDSGDGFDRAGLVDGADPAPSPGGEDQQATAPLGSVRRAGGSRTPWWKLGPRDAKADPATGGESWGDASHLLAEAQSDRSDGFSAGGDPADESTTEEYTTEEYTTEEYTTEEYAVETHATDGSAAPEATREPELFDIDAQDAEVAGESGEPGHGAGGDTAGPGTPVDPTALDEEELLRAYSWDGSPESAAEASPAGRRRRGWSLRRRSR